MSTDNSEFHNNGISTEDTGEKNNKNNQTEGSSTFKKTAKTLLNKYLIATLIFLVWILFFDNNNLISRHKIKHKLNNSYRQKRYYEQEIETNEHIKEQLTNNLKSIEAFGREQYLMKRDNEDIYLIIDEVE